MSTPPTPIFYDKAQVCLVDSGPITAPGLDRVQFAISTIPCVVIAVSRHSPKQQPFQCVCLVMGVGCPPPRSSEISC